MLESHVCPSGELKLKTTKTDDFLIDASRPGSLVAMAWDIAPVPLYGFLP